MGRIFLNLGKHFCEQVNFLSLRNGSSPIRQRHWQTKSWAFLRSVLVLNHFLRPSIPTLLRDAPHCPREAVVPFALCFVGPASNTEPQPGATASLNSNWNGTWSWQKCWEAEITHLLVICAPALLVEQKSRKEAQFFVKI